MFCKLALGNVRRSFRDYGVYLLTLTFGVCLFYVFNSLETQAVFQYLGSGPQAPTAQAIRELIGMLSVFVWVVLAFLIRVIRKGKKMVPYLQKAFLFVAFIGACIVCSSVTIRVEMRWVYVAYAAALLFFAYLSRVMGKAGILVLLYGCLIFPVETYYRDNWDNLYLWAPQSQYNSLAEKTYGTYGDDIFDNQRKTQIQSV